MEPLGFHGGLSGRTSQLLQGPLFSFNTPYPYTPSLGYQMVSTLGLKAGKLLHWPSSR